MSDSRGIYVVAFGEEYLRVAAGAVKAAVDVTGLPCVVAANSNPDKYDWPEGTVFHDYDLRDEENRKVRVRADRCSPFDRTLMIDADALIVEPIVVDPLSWLEWNDLCLVQHKMIGDYEGASCWRHTRTWLNGRVRIFLGGMIYFRKSDAATSFFQLWERLWKRNGCGRDMAALLEAAIQSPAKVMSLSADDGWFGLRTGAVRHLVGETAKGLPRMARKLRPVEGKDGEQAEWQWVETRK